MAWILAILLIFGGGYFLLYGMAASMADAATPPGAGASFVGGAASLVIGLALALYLIFEYGVRFWPK